MRAHTKTKCPTTGKRQYHERVRLLIEHATRPTTARAYLCPDCGYWHLTRKEQRDL